MAGGDRNGHGSRVGGAARVRPGQRYQGHGVHHRNLAGNGTRLVSATSERPSQQLVAVSFFLLTAYIVSEAIHALPAVPLPRSRLGHLHLLRSRGGPLSGPGNPAGFCGGRRDSPIGSLTGCQRPPPPSHTQPRNTWSDGISSLVCDHPATLRNCLILKQVVTRSDDVQPGSRRKFCRLPRYGPFIRNGH